MIIHILPMQPAHYEQIYQLWTSIEGLDITGDDTPEAIADFLAFNPNLNYVAIQDNEVVGVIMCGFDGRRATIYHMAVDPKCRNSGIASQLYAKVENALKNKGVFRGRLFAFKDNQLATNFWLKSGWHILENVNYFQKTLD